MPAPFSFHPPAYPRLMGILNITPNSFSDGGAFLAAPAALAHALELLHSGATLLDLGAEASSFFRQDVLPTDPPEQLRRLAPVLHQLSALHHPAWISIDTRSAAVAQSTLHAGAHIINDISAGTHDPLMLPTIAHARAGIILMHMGPQYPATPTIDDPDIVTTVRTALEERIAAAQAAGIATESIAVDPGIGFGKTMADNWRLAFRAREIIPAGMPVVLGASRKRFLETVPPVDVKVPNGFQSLVETLKPLEKHPRDAISAALTGFLAEQGIEIHRVHDVALAQRALREVIGPNRAAERAGA